MPSEASVCNDLMALWHYVSDISLWRVCLTQSRDTIRMIVLTKHLSSCSDKAES